MPEFQKKVAKFTHKGMQWNRPIDTIPDGQICYGRNVRVTRQDTISQRPGLTNFTTLSSGISFLHSVAVLNNYNPDLVNFSKVFVLGGVIPAGPPNYNAIFVGDTPAHLNNVAINPIKLPPIGQTFTPSGNPLTFVDMAPVGTNVGWKYIGDANMNISVGYYPGDNPAMMARALTMGMTPPVNTTIPSATGTGSLTGMYQWRFAFRNKYTGARSNPSAPTRNDITNPLGLGLQCTAQNATFTCPITPTDPQTGGPDTNIVIDIYRYGGTVFDWRYVGTGTSSMVFVDTLADADIQTASTPPEITDPTTGVTRYNLYRPFVVQDNARYSTTNASVNLSPSNSFIITAQGADVFDMNWTAGSAISVNNHIFSIFQVISPVVLELAENAGGDIPLGSNTVPWASQTGTLKMGAALPHIWGPYGIGSGGAFIFGCGGSNADAGTLYWTNGNDPDSADIANSLVVTSPSEPLRGGCVYDGTPFVWSTERMFRIYPGAVAGQFTVQEVPGGKGLWAEYSLTVQSNGIADQSVSWVGKDGIYDWSSTAGLLSLTDRDMYPFFPHDNQPGINLTTLFPFLAPGEPLAPAAPDFSSPNMIYHRLCWYQGELFYDHPTATGYNTLVFDSKQANGWVSLDQYSNGSSGISSKPVARGIEIGASNMKVAVGNALLDYTGSTDAGSAISCRLVTRQDDLGDSRTQKLYGDYMFDAAAGNAAGGISITPIVDYGNTFLGLFGVGTAARTQNVFSTVLNGLGTLSLSFGLNVTWTAGSTPTTLYQYDYSFVPKPELTYTRATDKTDDGYNGAKFLRGLCIEANTFNQARTVNVLIDGNNVASLTVTANGQTEIPFAFGPVVGSEFQLQPTDANAWELFAIRWVWEKWPDLTVLHSNWMDLGTTKPKYIRGFTIPVAGPAAPLLSFSVAYDGANFYTTTGVAPSAAQVKSYAQYSFNPPILAHQLNLIPSTPCRCWYDEIKWDAEEWPELAPTFSGPVENLGTSGAKYLRGFELPIETNGQPAEIELKFDSQTTATTGLTITQLYPAVTTDPLSKNVFPFTPTVPIIAHEFQVVSVDPARFWYSEIKWDFEPWPEFDTGKSPWLDGGTIGAKYVRGITIPIETGGQPVTFDLITDTGVTVPFGPFTTSAGVKSPQYFAFSVPLIFHEFQITPLTRCRVWDQEIKWDAEPWPELWAEATPWMDGGTIGAKFVRGITVPIETNGAPVTFDLITDTGLTVSFGPFVTGIGVKCSQYFAFAVPLIFHEFYILPLAKARVWDKEIKWDAESWPELWGESSAWLDNGTPSAKFVRGITMPIDSAGQPVTFDLFTDTGVQVPFGPFTTIPSVKTSVYCGFAVPLVFHQFRIAPRTNSRCWYGEIKWDADPWPENEVESSSWGDAGYQGAKFMQGLVIPMDTGGKSVMFDVITDNGTYPVGPFTTIAGQKTTVAYSFPVPFICHNLLLTPRTSCSVFYDEVKWVWEPVPELVTTYTTQPTNHDLPGYHYLFDVYIAYIGSADPPNFTVTTEFGSITYPLPVSNGVYTRAYLLVNPQKSKWKSYSITSTGGIRLFLKDCEVRCKNWTDKGNYPSAFTSHQPFGDESRRVGARI